MRVHALFWVVVSWLQAPVTLNGQSLWSPLDQGVSTGGPRVMLEDTLNDILYVGGASYHAGIDVTSPGIVAWNGSEFSALGCGFNWDCVSQLSDGGMANPITALALWQGDLYAGGGISSASGVPISRIARWNGTVWEPLAGGLNGPVYRLHGYDEGLYAVGLFTEADGIEANGIARWDGSEWQSVFDLPQLGLGVNYIYDMAWYNNELYICGNFVGEGGMIGIARHDGTSWRSVGDGIRGSFSLVNLLEVHNGLLYVAGAFAKTQPYGPPDNPGCGIVTWDGENWGELGTGTCGANNPTIYRMTWINDTLYVTGRFNVIGGVPTGRVAKWDGQRWCSLVPPNYFYPDIGALGSFRDTLIVGGSFTVAGPDSIDRIAKWIGGSYTSACGTAVGLGEERAVTEQINPFPNPATTQFTLALAVEDLGDAVFLYDATGRVMFSTTVTNTTLAVDVAHLANGIYTVQIGEERRTRILVCR